MVDTLSHWRYSSMLCRSIFLIGVIVLGFSLSLNASEIASPTPDATSSKADTNTARLIDRVTGIIASPARSSGVLPPEIEADVLLTALENSPDDLDENKNSSSAQEKNKMQGIGQDTKLSASAPNVSPAKVTDPLDRISKLLPKVQKIFPLNVAPYRLDVLERPTSTLVRMTLQTRLSALKSKSYNRQAFEDLLQAMNVLFPRLPCGTKIGQTDAQMHEWLSSLALGAKEKREQVDLLIRAMAAAKSSFAIGVYSRAILSNDWGNAERSRLVSAFNIMLSGISVDRYVNSQILYADLINVRDLVEKYGARSDLGKSIIFAADDYISRRISAVYCDDYLRTDYYRLETIYISEALPNSGFRKVDIASFPASTYKEFTEGQARDIYQKHLSTNLGKVLAGPDDGEVNNTSELITFVDRMLPGSEGFAKNRLVTLLLYDWVHQDRPAPPAVPGLMRAFTILNDDHYWNGDTENWRNAVTTFFREVNLADNVARDQIMALALSGKHQGLRLYATLAADDQITNAEQIARTREAEKAEKKKALDDEAEAENATDQRKPLLIVP